MRLDSGILSLAPSDLSRHLGCAHATTLALEAARGERAEPHARRRVRAADPREGRRARARLPRAASWRGGLEVTEIERSGSYADMAARTRSAMEAGVAVDLPGDVRARPLARPCRLPRARRAARPALGAFGYEAVDTKLARNEARPCARPATVLLQRGHRGRAGRRRRSTCTSQLGSGRRESLRPRDFDAYFARAQRSLERFVDAPPATVAVSVRGLRDVRVLVRLRRGVARQGRPLATSRRSGARRPSRSRPRESRRSRRWPTTRSSHGPSDLKTGTLTTLHEQAELQEATRSNGTIATELVLPVEEGRGFERLPEPSRARSGDRPRGRSVLARRPRADLHVRTARPRR